MDDCSERENMAKRLSVPPSLQHLVEKRERADRRKKSVAVEKPMTERRSTQARRTIE